MIAFPGMLAVAAEKAGMKTPPDPENFDKSEYPHFEVFCTMQLGKPVRYHGEHWENAKVIAALSDEEVKKVTLVGLMDKGFSY